MINNNYRFSVLLEVINKRLKINAQEDTWMPDNPMTEPQKPSFEGKKKDRCPKGQHVDKKTGQCVVNKKEK